MTGFSHVAIATTAILIRLAACHLSDTSSFQHRDDVSLLQTVSKLDGRRSVLQPPPSGPPDILHSYGPQIYTEPLSAHPQCWNTPGGGCAGGYEVDGAVNTPYGIAPAHHFPATAGCRWTSPKRIALIHVGKCAGESLQRMLNNAPVNFTHVHQNWLDSYFDPNDYDLFIVSTRDPVSRLVSAYNWRHPDMNVLGAFGSWGPVEEQMYQCFMQYPGSANAWAESLNESTRCGALSRRCMHSQPARCAHLARGFFWYLDFGRHRGSASLLRTVERSQGQKQVIMVSSENFTAEADAMFEWLCVPPEARPEDSHVHEDYPRHNDTELSPMARQNLEDHTADEYFALKQLGKLAAAV